MSNRIETYHHLQVMDEQLQRTDQIFSVDFLWETKFSGFSSKPQKSYELREV